MRHPKMNFQTIVILIVSVLLLLATDITKIMIHINMSLELILIEVVLMAETAIWMHKGYIAKLIDISLLEMFVQCFEGV